MGIYIGEYLCTSFLFGWVSSFKMVLFHQPTNSLPICIAWHPQSAGSNGKSEVGTRDVTAAIFSSTARENEWHVRRQTTPGCCCHGDGVIDDKPVDGQLSTRVSVSRWRLPQSEGGDERGRAARATARAESGAAEIELLCLARPSVGQLTAADSLCG